MGSSDGNTATSNAVVNYIKWSDNNSYFDMNSFGDGRVTVSAASTPSTGLYVQNRIANNLQYVYRRGLQFGSDNTSVESDGLPTTRDITIGGAFVPPSNRWSNRECAFASIGDALTKAENVTFNTIVQNFQTTLGRNV